MRRRRLRWIAVIIVVVIGLYFVFDVVAVQYLESRGAAELARAMAAEDATIELGSTPFLPSFLRGRLTRAELDVRGASATGGLRVQSLKARMIDVRFSWSDVFSLARSSFATRTKVKGLEPVGILELGEGDLEEFLRRHIPFVGDVQISTSGIEARFVTDPSKVKPGREPKEEDLTKPARFLPRIIDRRLVLSLVGLSQIPDQLRSEAGRIERAIDLPRVPEGLRTDVRLGDGVVIVEATGREVELWIGEGEK